MAEKNILFADLFALSIDWTRQPVNYSKFVVVFIFESVFSSRHTMHAVVQKDFRWQKQRSTNRMFVID